MKIIRLVITGGPCAGKSKLLPMVKECLTSWGWKSENIFMIPEAATELMENGLSYKNRVEFQRAVLKLQIEKETLVERYIRNTCDPNDDCIIVCDRGALDSSAYCSSEEWTAITKAESVYEHHLINRYDAVIHLDSAALLEDPSLYTNKNNPHRSESRAEAIVLNLAIKMAYGFYDSIIHVTVPACSTFEEKKALFNKALSEILTTFDQQ